MRTKLFTLLFIIILFIPKAIYAAEAYGAVERIYPHNGKVYFRLKGDKCKNKSLYKYWYFELNSEESKLWFSMLLTASSTGKIVKIGVQSCKPDENQKITYIYQDF